MTERWRPPVHPMHKDLDPVDPKVPQWKTSDPKAPKPFEMRCNRCHSSGRIPCEMCSGRGETIVGRDMRGHPKYGSCRGCMGLKTMRCRGCGGVGWTS